MSPSNTKKILNFTIIHHLVTSWMVNLKLMHWKKSLNFFVKLQQSKQRIRNCKNISTFIDWIKNSLTFLKNFDINISIFSVSDSWGLEVCCNGGRQSSALDILPCNYNRNNWNINGCSAYIWVCRSRQNYRYL